MKLTTLKVTFSIIAVVIAILAYFGFTQKLEMDHKREQRTAFKHIIDKEIAEKYNGMIVESELDGHCGIALYEIKVLDGDKQVHELYYNIDTGEQLKGEITKNCDDLLKVVQ